MPKVFLEVFIASKRPNVPCFSYQSPFKNLFTRANMSCTPFDIQRSKLDVVELHFAKVSKHSTI
jgi:hypothetical protein